MRNESPAASEVDKIDLRKCTIQCHETQANDSTQALSTKTVCFGCKKIDIQTTKEEEAKKRTDKKELMYLKKKSISVFWSEVWPDYAVCCV